MKYQFIFLVMLIFLASCGNTGNSENKNEATKESTQVVVSSDPKDNIGVGPITEIQLGELDPKMAEAGKAIFDAKCTACHKIDAKYIGPAVKGVINRRNPVWIMNMILSPDKMIAQDPIAKQLLSESNGAPMANQNLTETEARQILEYFRQIQ